MKVKLKKYMVCAIDEKLPQQVELHVVITDYGNEEYYWSQTSTSKSDINTIKLFNNEEDVEKFIENMELSVIYSDDSFGRKPNHSNYITSNDVWVEEVDVTIDLPW